VHLLQQEGAQVKAWEPFKPDAKLKGIYMAARLEEAIEDADLIVLLVKHTEFVNLKPDEIASKTSARVLIDCVNGWNTPDWEENGFIVHRLGVNPSKIANRQSQV
jgi:UDP-N-acetyl-D-mannosaminuronic acid dehydrogenase